LTEACVRPPGMAHLEDPKLTSDLTVARDFDLGMTGPPLFIAMDFIAGGLIEMIGGLACAAVLAAYAWWAPFLLLGPSLGRPWRGGRGGRPGAGAGAGRAAPPTPPGGGGPPGAPPPPPRAGGGPPGRERGCGFWGGRGGCSPPPQPAGPACTRCGTRPPGCA